jgi:hypothetical protein
MKGAQKVELQGAPAQALELRSRLPQHPPPYLTHLEDCQYAAWPDLQQRTSSPVFFSLLCAVHETAGSAVCLPTPGFTFADLRFVCSSFSSFASKAD